MQQILDYLVQYWYLGIIVFILIWEVIRFILLFIIKKTFGIVFFPLKAVMKIIFGNAKIVNYELLVLLLIAIGFIIYLTYIR